MMTLFRWTVIIPTRLLFSKCFLSVFCSNQTFIPNPLLSLSGYLLPHYYLMFLVISGFFFFFFYLLRYYLSRLASCIFLQPSNRSPQTWLTKVKDGAHLSPLVQLDPQSAEVAVKSGQTGETYLEITFSPICACCCLWCTRYQFNQLPPGQSMHEC